MPAIIFMKLNEDTLVGWLHESCQLFPSAREAGFELREDFQVAVEQQSNKVEFWQGSPFNQ